LYLYTTTLHPSKKIEAEGSALYTVPNSMCKFCYSILGSTIPHKEADCALKQASVCPLCGPCSHFLEDCPKQVLQSSFATPIPEHIQELAPAYLMGDTNLGYIEYQKLYKLEVHSRIEKNKAIVEEHLKKRGFRLVFPPKSSTVPLNSSQTSCGLSHGGNMHCIAVVQPVKKKIVLRRK